MSNSQDTSLNNEWHQRVRIFREGHGSSNLTSRMREELGQLANQFYQTTRDMEMQSLLTELHWRYNLTGLIAPEFLLNTFFLVNRARGSLASTLLAPLTGATTLSASPAPPTPSRPSGALVGANRPTAAATPALNEESRSQLRKCHPPNLQMKRTIGCYDKTWLYIYDACGHGVPRSAHFCFHVKIGADRPGFKIISVDTEGARKWYGLDDAGNEYIGDMVLLTQKQKRKGGNPLVGPPCGSRIREDNAARKERKVERDRQADSVDTDDPAVEEAEEYDEFDGVVIKQGGDMDMDD
jgi:hypothetical protein